MSQFAVSWRLSRGRFDEAVGELTHAQLTWRLHPGTLTLGEAAVHVAGVEVWFIAQLTGKTLEGFGARVAQCATEGVVNDHPFPFPPDELTPETIGRALALGREAVGAVIENPSPDLLKKEIKSALGPIITGEGALARLAFHPGYHQGQAHLIRTATGFPGSQSAPPH